MEKGEMRGISLSEVMIDNFLNPVHFAGKSELLDRMMRIAKKYPPIMEVNETKAMELILSDNNGTSYFLVAGNYIATDYGMAILIIKFLYPLNKIKPRKI